MAAAAVETPPAPAVPDYMTDPDAALKDSNVTWRLGRAPDYSKTRKYWAESMSEGFPTGASLGVSVTMLIHITNTLHSQAIQP